MKRTKVVLAGFAMIMSLSWSLCAKPAKTSDATVDYAITVAGKKEGNSAEKDFNKALVYILSSNNEIGFFHRMAKSIYNTWKFNDKIQFAPRNLADILCAIIQFKDRKTIAKLIIRYMKTNRITVKPEFLKYA